MSLQPDEVTLTASLAACCHSCRGEGPKGRRAEGANEMLGDDISDTCHNLYIIIYIYIYIYHYI